MRAKPRRRSNAEFRGVGGQDNEAHQWHTSGVPDSPTVIRAKANIPKLVGFDAILDDVATPVVSQGG